MVLLLLFALIAGVGTALSPCVLPVLPVALSGGATGGRRRPLGIVTGLALSFTFATVALVYVIDALGLPDDLLRTFAIAVLLVFGISLAVPPLSARIEAWLSARFGRDPTAGRDGEGFGSGVVLGLGLGVVYVPCAGPILAGVITVSASQDFTAGRLAVALAYGIGSAAGLYVLMLGGRRLIRPLSERSGRVQQALGVTMALVAVLMALNLDTRFQTAIASDLPSFLVNPTEQIEGGDSTRERLARLRDREAAAPLEAGAEVKPKPGGRLPVLGTAPELVGTQKWFNTPGGRKLTLRSLRGRVVLIDFWTYTCINCIRTLPELKAWDRTYSDRGFTTIGVHTPEFAFEKDAGNVEDAIDQNGLRYPVAQDNEMATWNAFGNQFWPAKYLIDARGRVRYTRFGEGGYEETEDAIRSLLAEAGRERLGRESRARVQQPSVETTTPELYLGSARADRAANGPLEPGAADFGALGVPPPDSFALGGPWIVSEESSTAGRGARLALDFGARRVFLVMSSRGRARSMRVLLDGKPLPERLAGADVRDGSVRVDRQRLYRLVELPAAERHRLTLVPEAGIAGYAFTFG